MKGKAMGLPDSPILSMDAIREAAEAFKADLMGEAKRAIREKNFEAATTAIAASEHIDKFMYALQLRAGSQLDAGSHRAKQED